MGRIDVFAEAYFDNVPAKVLTPRLEHLKEVQQLESIEILIDEFDDPVEGRVVFYYYSKKAIRTLKTMYHICPKFRELIRNIVLKESKRK